MSATAQYTVVDAAALTAQLDRIEKRLATLPDAPAKPTAEAAGGYMTRKQVAAYFGVSLTSVHAWVGKGMLNVYKIGHRTLFKRAEIEAAPELTRPTSPGAYQ